MTNPAIEALNRAVTVRAGDTLLLLMPFDPADADNLTEMADWLAEQFDDVKVRFITGITGAVVQHTGESIGDALTSAGVISTGAQAERAVGDAAAPLPQCCADKPA